jgi:DNA replication protein DnaC
MNPTATPDLQRVLKRLKLSGILPTLPDRAAFALDQKLHPLAFLELCLSDEIERRDAKNLRLRIERAHLDEVATLERFDWSARITIDRARVTDLFGLTFLHHQQDVIFQGPTGVGKTFLASALAHAAIRAGHRVLSIRSDTLLKTMHQSRADHSTERVLRSYLTPTLLLIDLWGARGYVELESLVRAGRGGSRGRSTYLQRVLSQSVSFGGGVGRGSLLGARWSGKTWVRACRLVSRSARA